MSRNAHPELNSAEHTMTSHPPEEGSVSSAHSGSVSASSRSRVHTSSDTKSEAISNKSSDKHTSQTSENTENTLTGAFSILSKTEKQSGTRKRPTFRIDKGEKRLKKQLSVRFRKKKMDVSLSALPKLPTLEEFRNNSIIIHHAERGTLSADNKADEPKLSTDREGISKSANLDGRSGRRSGRQVRQSKSQPSLLPTIPESAEIPEHKNEDVQGGRTESRLPAIPSLVDAYQRLSFAQSTSASGSDDAALQFAPARSVWRTLPMQSELDTYLSSLQHSKKQTHSFSRHILPGLGFNRGGPIARPHSGSQRNQYLRQKTRFGDDVTWGQKEGGRKRTSAATLKSAKFRTDKLFSELKNILEEKR